MKTGLWISLASNLRELVKATETGRKDKGTLLCRHFTLDCYSMKLELLTNATVVDDAIRFVQSNRHSNNGGVEQVSEAKRTKYDNVTECLTSDSNTKVYGQQDLLVAITCYD